ncbi:MAG: membrane protein insertion efficiency factor YidD [Clostridiales bacterium]|jgi:putative membrane protein insertion efficiency factor|nr:membrane protein insertion efficiency factor YidD [Clostridiales bacterium]
MFDYANVNVAKQLDVRYNAVLHATQHLQLANNHNIFATIVSILTLRWVFVVLIYLYRWLLSPILPRTCIYHPTCSTYCLQAIRSFGTIRGTMLATKRILRCHPFAIGGVDLLPDNINGVVKWLL